MMERLASPEAWAALFTLTLIEIVFGIGTGIPVGDLRRLTADGFQFHIPRAYIYFSMFFAGAVELFNVLAKGNRKKAPRPSGSA